MIPWYYAAITAGFGFVAGFVLALIDYHVFRSLAERAKRYAAQQTGEAAKSIKGVSDSLKQPGK